ncbi:MAG: toll/interleukin-1 receptor domain-containing protein [Methanomicrobiaceae archaeon]|nr:toll/interleukin-1 receptor domain-containing protein [Methanomicrobiaceae archaeon]
MRIQSFPQKIFLLAFFICIFILPFSVHAETLTLFDMMPKSINGENSIYLQSRVDNNYKNLIYLSNRGESWFGTPGTFKVKPVITKGPFPDGTPYDKLAIFSFPSAIIQTGFKADSVIRVTIPGNGGLVNISGQTAVDGMGSGVSHYRFYIYKGEDQFSKPLWESEGNGNFHFQEKYLANDQVFFAVEALDSDDELAPKWKYVVLETYSEQSSATPASPQPQGTSSYGIPFFPLSGAFIVIILIFCCLSAFLYYRKSRVSDEKNQSGIQLPNTNFDSGVRSGGSVSQESVRHHDVFISYSSKDKPVGDAVCAGLEAHGIRCWIAPRDVEPGENFPDAIIQAIEQSRVMVLIFSSSSNNSPHVIRELTKAFTSGLIIIPFRIEDVPLSRSMEYLIGLPHWLDAVTPPLQEHISDLARSVLIILKTCKEKV